MDTTNPYAPPGAAVADVALVDQPVELAERGTRFVAAFLDGIVVIVIVYLPLMLRAGAAEESPAESGGAAVVALIAGLAALVGVVVWCWFTIKYVVANGQSIGKKMVHIKVVRSDGSRASFGRIFWLRNVVNGLLGFIPLYGFVELLFIFGTSRQCLHDRIADTIVIKA